MNIAAHPELLDRLAAAWALGTLRGGARRRFEAMARQSAAVRAAALLWQERFAAMTELQAAQRPSPNVWIRIENLLAAQRTAPAAAPPRPDRSLRWWRAGAMAGALASVAALGVALNLGREAARGAEQVAQLGRDNAQLAAQLRAAPDIQYVAVLSDGRTDAQVLVTFEPSHQRLVLKRIGGVQQVADKSLQLWALPPGGGPRSLGVLGDEPVVRLAADTGEIRDVPALAISLEPRGGVPSAGGPTGPVLYKGALLRTPR